MLIQKVADEMLDLYNDQKFSPRVVEDLGCLMYHLLLQQGVDLSLLHADLPIQFKASSKYPDIVVGDPQNLDQCEIVQLKFMGKGWDLQSGRITRREETSLKDLATLSQIRCKPKFFIFFNEAKPLTDKMKKRLTGSMGRDVIFILLENRQGRMTKVQVDVTP